MTRRLNYVSNRQYQFQILIRILAIILIVAFVTSLNMTIAYLFIMSRTYSPEEAKTQFTTVLSELWQEYRIYAALILVIDLVVALILGLFFSHKLAGPIYRMCRGLEQVSEGDLTARFKVRKGDILGNFPHDIDIAMTTLRNRIVVLKNLVSRLSHSQHIPEDMMETVHEIEAKLDQINTTLPRKKPKGE